MAKYTLFAILVLLGVTLLLAGKIVAGMCFVVIAATVLPLRRLVRNARAARWTRLGVVVGLGAVAVVSIAGTDIPPGGATTGNPAVDKITVLAQNVRETLTGKREPAGMGHPGVGVPITNREDALAYARCMRSHGVDDFPDPVFHGDGISFPGVAELDTPRSTMETARASCRNLIRRGK